MADPINDLRAFTDRLRDAIGDMAAQQALRPMAEQAITIIVKRTRLGYGVPDGTNGTADRFKLPALSSGYVRYRENVRSSNRFAHPKKPHPQMSEFTSPRRSNLTLTGQMLDSIKVISIAPGSVRIGPTGTRAGGGPTNAQVAGYVAQQGRPFLSLSRLESEQLVRFYRNRFGDLLRNRRLT